MRGPAFWTARSPGERRVLAAGAALVALLLLAVLVWLPLERARGRLAAQLPSLRASVVEMRAQAEEARRLRALPERVASTATPLPALVASGTLGEGLPGVRLAAIDGNRLRLVAEDASWTRLAEWISGAQARHGLVVETATIDALAAAGRVRAELVLAAP